MIDKLIIGPWRGAQDEIESPHTEHPHRIAEWVRQLHHGSKKPVAVCTYSPTVIRRVIYEWDKDPLLFSWIVLRSDWGKDTPLLDVKDPDWLAHFGIDDLYMSGEFDAVLEAVL